MDQVSVAVYPDAAAEQVAAAAPGSDIQNITRTMITLASPGIAKLVVLLADGNLTVVRVFGLAFQHVFDDFLCPPITARFYDLPRLSSRRLEVYLGKYRSCGLLVAILEQFVLARDGKGHQVLVIRPLRRFQPGDQRL